MDKLEEISAFFNNRSNIYDIKHIESFEGSSESKRMIASFLPDNVKTVIDFGIGTGLELEEIYRRFPEVEITGWDIAENMLQKLKEKYAGKNIDLYCADYLHADFGENLYDAALSVMSLHHYNYEVKTDLYRRINQCLKQNGVYIECDYMLSEHEYENAQAEEDFFFSEYERIKREQGLANGRDYHYDTPCTVSNQKKMLLKAGFKNVEEVWRVKDTVILLANK